MKPEVSHLVGKKAKVVHNTNGHQFEINTVVTLAENEDWELEFDSEVIGINKKGEWWYLKLSDLEILPDQNLYTEEQVLEKIKAFNKSLSMHIFDSYIIKWWEENK